MANRRTIMITREELKDGQALAYTAEDDAVVAGKSAINTRTWVWTTKTADAATTSQVGIDKTAWATATVVNLNEQANDNANVASLFHARGEGDIIRVQLKTDSLRFGRYQIMGPGIDHGTWWSFPVMHIESAGNLPNGNAETLVSFVVNAAAIPM